MKVNPLFFALIASLFSCNTGVVQREVSALPPPRDITSQIGPIQAVLSWEAVEGASGYSVSYGKTRDYGTTVEITETSIVITGLEKDTTYYFAVRTKNGKEVSSLPKDIVITTTPGETNASDPTDSGDEKQEEPETKPVTQPFDTAVFAAEQAAWEALNLRDYRFVIELEDGTFTYPATITVSSNTEPKIESQEAPNLPFGATIDGIYTLIADKVASHTSGFVFQIAYHPTYHYPEYFLKRPAREGGFGGWYSLEISGFELLD
jgi:hypothetical protein